MKIGTVIEVTHPRFEGVRHVYKILLNNVENDGRGQFKLSTLIEEMPGEKAKVFEEGYRTMVVDINWFDTKLTGRKIKIIPQT